MRCRASVKICCLLLGWLTSPHAVLAFESEDQVKYFRSDRGLFSDSGPLPIDFSSSQHLVWRTPLASGHSTPCVWGDRIFVTEFDPDKQQLATVALDGHTGQVLWRQVAPADRIEPVHEVANPAAAAPACDGQRVYVFFGSYGLLCYDLEGRLIWSRPLGPFQDEFGSPSSPILVDDKLILNEDHDADNFLYAFDKATGKLIWQVNRDEFIRSYATPVVYRSGDQTQIIVAGALRLCSYDVQDGRLLWWVDGLARIVNPTPVIAGTTLYVATWSPGGDDSERIAMESFQEALHKYDRNKDGLIQREELTDGPVVSRFFRMDTNQDGALDQAEWDRHVQVFEQAVNGILAIQLEREGNITPPQVRWSYHRAIPYVPSPTHYDGTIFLVKDSAILTTLDAETGQLHKQGRLRGLGNYYASPVVADGKLYVASQQGVVTVTTAEPDWKVLATHDFGEDIYASPVVDRGRIYVRTSTAVYCFTRE